MKLKVMQPKKKTYLNFQYMNYETRNNTKGGRGKGWGGGVGLKKRRQLLERGDA